MPMLKYKTTNEKEKNKCDSNKSRKVMHEFKAGELHIGKSDTIVTNPKQAIAIALNEANGLKKSKK